MKRYRLVIHGDEEGERVLTLEAPSINIALLVADINMSGGVAELWQGEKLLGRMRKRNGLTHPLWELA